MKSQKQLGDWTWKSGLIVPITPKKRKQPVYVVSKVNIFYAWNSVLQSWQGDYKGWGRGGPFKLLAELQEARETTVPGYIQMTEVAKIMQGHYCHWLLPKVNTNLEKLQETLKSMREKLDDVEIRYSEDQKRLRQEQESRPRGFWKAVFKQRKAPKNPALMNVILHKDAGIKPKD